MRIVWQDRAESDLDGIAEHMMETDPSAALRVVSAIRDVARMLAEHLWHRARWTCGWDARARDPGASLA